MLNAPATRLWTCQAEPFRIRRLLEMVEFFAGAFNCQQILARRARTNLQVRADAEGPGAHLTKNDNWLIGVVSKNIERTCEQIGLDDASLVAAKLNREINWEPDAPRLCLTVATDLEALLLLIEKGLEKQKFAYVPGDHQKYFEQKNLFRLPCPSPFPSAEDDTKDAGNAYAMGLYTASVYHLMRVAEIGLRVFAKHLRIKLPKKHNKPVPLDRAQWDDVLVAMGKKIDSLSVAPKKSVVAKAAIRVFYRGAFAEFQGFKEMYRNDVAHVRVRYTRTDAESAIIRVGEFMRRLGARVHE